MAKQVTVGMMNHSTSIKVDFSGQTNLFVCVSFSPSIAPRLGNCIFVVRPISNWILHGRKMSHQRMSMNQRVHCNQNQRPLRMCIMEPSSEMTTIVGRSMLNRTRLCEFSSNGKTCHWNCNKATVFIVSGPLVVYRLQPLKSSPKPKAMKY